MTKPTTAQRLSAIERKATRQSRELAATRVLLARTQAHVITLCHHVERLPREKQTLLATREVPQELRR